MTQELENGTDVVVDANTDVVDDNAPAEDVKPDRWYIVVLMPEDMKAQLTTFAKENDTTPTGLARKLLADHIGYVLTEPESAPRSKYANDAERHDAHKLASKKSGLLRKALYQAHQGQLTKRAGLTAAANKIVMDLSDPKRKWSKDELEGQDAFLNAAIKGGK